MIFGITGTSSLQVGGVGALASYEEFCRPMFLPLAPDLITWTSLDPTTASVSAGTVRGLAPGLAVIQATYAGMTQQVGVIVEGTPAAGSSPPMRLRIVGCPAMSALQRGVFRAFEIFDNGAVSPVSPVWASSRPAVAGFAAPDAGADGRPLDAFTAGTTRVVAQYQRLTAAMTVTVAGR